MSVYLYKLNLYIKLQETLYRIYRIIQDSRFKKLQIHLWMLDFSDVLIFIFSQNVFNTFLILIAFFKHNLFFLRFNFSFKFLRFKFWFLSKCRGLLLALSFTRSYARLWNGPKITKYLQYTFSHLVIVKFFNLCINKIKRLLHWYKSSIELFLILMYIFNIIILHNIDFEIRYFWLHRGFLTIFIDIQIFFLINFVLCRLYSKCQKIYFPKTNWEECSSRLDFELSTWNQISEHIHIQITHHF